jgi:Leucine-rich repeat (LRR) protein
VDIFFLPVAGNVSLEEIVPLSRLNETAETMTAKHKNQPYKCYYENLQYFEETGNEHIGKHHFEFLTDHSVYPKLEIFNFSSNYYPRIPKQLTRWFQHFPSLRVLDLSNNEIREFSFEHPYLSQSMSLYIDLSNNNITSVPADLTTYLSGRTPILMNLLGNPIHCDCRASVLSQYLQALQQIDPQYKALSDVLCHSPRKFAGVAVHSINFQNQINCFL